MIDFFFTNFNLSNMTKLKLLDSLLQEVWEGIKKIVENSTRGPIPPPLVEKSLLAKNDLHVMKRILYNTGPRVVARWLRERVSKLRNSVLVKRPPTPLKNGKK